VGRPCANPARRRPPTPQRRGLDRLPRKRAERSRPQSHGSAGTSSGRPRTTVERQRGPPPWEPPRPPDLWVIGEWGGEATHLFTGMAQGGSCEGQPAGAAQRHGVAAHPRLRLQCFPPSGKDRLLKRRASPRVGYRPDGPRRSRHSSRAPRGRGEGRGARPGPAAPARRAPGGQEGSVGVEPNGAQKAVGRLRNAIAGDGDPFPLLPAIHPAPSRSPAVDRGPYPQAGPPAGMRSETPVRFDNPRDALAMCHAITGLDHLDGRFRCDDPDPAFLSVAHVVPRIAALLPCRRSSLLTRRCPPYLDAVPRSPERPGKTARSPSWASICNNRFPRGPVAHSRTTPQFSPTA